MAPARDAVEARLRLKNMDAYLKAEYVEIVLTRPTWVKTLAGGRVKGPDVDLPPQKFRLVPFKRRLTEIALDKPEGTIVELNYVLVGYHDADVQPDDWFKYDGKFYEIDSVDPNRSERTACVLTYRG